MRRTRHEWILPIALFTVALVHAPATAQDGNVKDSPLFVGVKDPKIVASQVRTALPAYARGLDLLNGATDPETTESAVRFLLDAYRYLRGAYEGNQLILVSSKFPDPLLELQNRQILDVRHGLLYCTGQRTNLSTVDSIRTTCVEGLTRGLRTLRVLAVSLQ
jgi:hypothetical protein